MTNGWTAHVIATQISIRIKLVRWQCRRFKFCSFCHHPRVHKCEYNVPASTKLSFGMILTVDDNKASCVVLWCNSRICELKRKASRKNGSGNRIWSIVSGCFYPSFHFQFVSQLPKKADKPIHVVQTKHIELSYKYWPWQYIWNKMQLL